MSNLDELVERFRNKERRALSRLLTLASQSESAQAIRATLQAAGETGRVVAITGNAGVGKSSLISRLVELLRSTGQSVAVLACDPESPLSGGALLGDRIRISGACDDSGLFIRSVAARSGQQGIAENLDLMVQILLAFGFEIVLIETVGTGQGDTAVRRFAEVLVLLLQPQTGDALQWEKAGLLEVADVIVVNKADLPGADQVRSQVEQQMNLPGRPAVPVMTISALEREGLEKLWEAIKSLPGPAAKGR